MFVQMNENETYVDYETIYKSMLWMMNHFISIVKEVIDVSCSSWNGALWMHIMHEWTIIIIFLPSSDLVVREFLGISKKCDVNEINEVKWGFQDPFLLSYHML